MHSHSSTPSRRENTGIYWKIEPVSRLKSDLYLFVMQCIAFKNLAYLVRKLRRMARFGTRFQRPRTGMIPRRLRQFEGEESAGSGRTPPKAPGRENLSGNGTRATVLAEVAPPREGESLAGNCRRHLLRESSLKARTMKPTGRRKFSFRSLLGEWTWLRRPGIWPFISCANRVKNSAAFAPGARSFQLRQHTMKGSSL